MAVTKVADIVVPAVFGPYALERAVELSDIIQSGAMERSELLDALCNGGGKTTDMPFFKDLTGDTEVLSESASLTPDKIPTGDDIAAFLARGKAWGQQLLAKWLSGDDPLRQIGDLVGGYWARGVQRILMKILLGLFDHTAGVLKDTHRLNIYSDVAPGSVTDAMRFLGDSTFIDATLKLGDASIKIVAVCMHSDVEGLLRKRQMVEDVQPATGVGPRIPILQGRRIVVDDSCPKVAGTNSPHYITYLFGRAALGHGVRTKDDGVDNPDTEVERNGLAGETYLITRRRMLIHPMGVKYTATPGSGGPTDAELTTAANWAKVYSDKNIAIVAVRHNV
jgi:hypothetical protein